jgi:hypothetical protein
MGAFEDYRESVTNAREWFDRTHASVVASCNVLNQGFVELGRCLQLGRDAENHTHVSLGPLLFILQRQAFVAMDTLASRQAYQSWLLVRPGIESGLVIGKWLDSVENYNIWNERAKHPKRYAKEYQGQNLRSVSLPRSTEFQSSLKTINDLFAHPNPDYYLRHTEARPADHGNIILELKFFDSDEFHWASVLGMLHLLILMQDSIARAFAERFVNIDHYPDHYGLSRFQHDNRAAAVKAAEGGTLIAQVINDIGLWHLASGA